MKIRVTISHVKQDPSLSPPTAVPATTHPPTPLLPSPCQTSLDGLVSTSTLELVVTPQDEGSKLTCRAENPELSSATIEDSHQLQVLCEYFLLFFFAFFSFIFPLSFSFPFIVLYFCLLFFVQFSLNPLRLLNNISTVYSCMFH